MAATDDVKYILALETRLREATKLLTELVESYETVVEQESLGGPVLMSTIKGAFKGTPKRAWRFLSAGWPVRQTTDGWRVGNMMWHAR